MENLELDLLDTILNQDGLEPVEPVEQKFGGLDPVEQETGFVARPEVKYEVSRKREGLGQYVITRNRREEGEVEEREDEGGAYRRRREEAREYTEEELERARQRCQDPEFAADHYFCSNLDTDLSTLQ